MTTKKQNEWAQQLEGSSQKEVRQMAEYAIDHIEQREELLYLRSYLALAIGEKLTARQ